MADILIKNMEMPQERKMFVIEADGSVWVQIKDTSYFCTGSKAVALSSHGDLIDGDKASTQIIAEICQFCASAENGNCDGCLVQKCLEAIGRVPSIVEATE